MLFKKYWLIGLVVIVLGVNNCFAQGVLVTSVEAESGVMVGVNFANSIPGYSGTGYVTGFDNSSDKLTVTVTVPKKAFYQILIRYHSSDPKTQNMLINNVSAGGIDFPKSTVFTDKDAGKYMLNAGANTITIQSSWGWTEFDKFTIYTTLPNSYTNVVTDLVDSKASVATNSLYSFMLSQYTKRIISGQTEGQGDFDVIKKASGNYPLLKGYDLQPYSPMYSYSWANGGFAFGPDNNSPNIQNAINWYNSNSKKPIIQFQWHWHSPSGGTVGKNTFYTEFTTFDVSKAVIPGTQENKDALRDIDAIAVQLKKLRDAGVPVVWRPLHEAGGTWFWWNAKGGANYIKLWNILYDRIVNYHQIHNLIWAWTGNDLAWYPGNSKVDILGIDSYPGNFNYTINKGEFDKNYVISAGKKIVAMTENGPIPNIQDTFDGDAPWSYFMSWYDVNVGNDNQHLSDVFKNPKVITLENDTFPMIINAANASFCGTQSAKLQASANFGSVNWFAEPSGGAILQTGTNYTTPALTATTTFYAEASFNGRPGEMKRTPVTATFSVPATPVISSDGITIQSSAPDGNQWYFNNTLITNAVSSTYTPTEKGNYYSIVTMAECSSPVSNVINFTFTSIDDFVGKNDICIFPNPVEQGKTRITISGIDFTENPSVKIFDVNGKIVYSGFLIEQTIDLGKGIDAGIYLVNLTVNGKSYTEKLIVN